MGRGLLEAWEDHLGGTPSCVGDPAVLPRFPLENREKWINQAWGSIAMTLYVNMNAVL